MSRHNNPFHRPGDAEADKNTVDSMEEFANRVDRAVQQASNQVPGASALDPGLWKRIQQDARPPDRHDADRSTAAVSRRFRSSAPTPAEVNVPAIPPIDRSTSRRRPIPAGKWHRGLAAFLVVALAICAIVFFPDRPDEPENKTAFLQAPEVATPSPIDTEHCRVEPLTTDEVYAIVIDLSSRDDADARVLFPTLPPVGGDYPHTHSWLPESDGSVRVADESVQTRRPLPVEFQDAEASLNRYLRCQEEGTNFQLWALESPVEVQRQILRPLLQALDGNEEITEPMILDEIERLGPLPRQDEQYLAFITNRPPGMVNPLEGLRFEANPSIDDAFIADGTSGSTSSHAWIGTQLVDEGTGDIVLRRGAALDEPVPVMDGGAVPMVGTFILAQDDATGAWLVEWFIPSV